ncbi:MAG: DMT family transporter [Hydrogenophaga sp.]
MTAAAIDRPQGLPPGMGLGILAGLGAGAFWGTTFVAPLLTPGFGSVDLTVGRYLACALLSVLLLAWSGLRGEAQKPTLSQAACALGLSVLGYTGYYLLLVLAIADAGAALPVLIIGTIPSGSCCWASPRACAGRPWRPGFCSPPPAWR